MLPGSVIIMMHHQNNMKKTFLFLAVSTILLSSCRLLHLGRFREGQSGCPSNGKNVGAEKILSGDPKATAAAKKAGKFRKDKGLSN